MSLGRRAERWLSVGTREGTSEWTEGPPGGREASGHRQAPSPPLPTSTTTRSGMRAVETEGPRRGGGEGSFSSPGLGAPSSFAAQERP